MNSRFCVVPTVVYIVQLKCKQILIAAIPIPPAPECINTVSPILSLPTFIKACMTWEEKKFETLMMEIGSTLSCHALLFCKQ